MDFSKEEKPKDNEGKTIEDAAPVITIETRILNSMTPLWVKQKSEITTEEYHKFYQNIFHDWTDPLEIIHTKVEGAVEIPRYYSSHLMLLSIFIPGTTIKALNYIAVMFLSWITVRNYCRNISVLCAGWLIRPIFR